MSFGAFRFPLCSFVSFVVKVLGFPSRERNSLARVRKPRVKGEKPMSPQRGVIIEPRPSGLGTESKRNLPLCRRPSRSTKHEATGEDRARSTAQQDREGYTSALYS